MRKLSGEHYHCTYKVYLKIIREKYVVMRLYSKTTYNIQWTYKNNQTWAHIYLCIAAISSLVSGATCSSSCRYKPAYLDPYNSSCAISCSSCTSRLPCGRSTCGENCRKTNCRYLSRYHNFIKKRILFPSLLHSAASSFATHPL